MSGAPPPTHADPAARAPLASWYAQGLSDGLGDRLLMFDNASTAPLELLRVRPDLAHAPGFEQAVRTQFEALSRITHEGLAQTRSIEHLDGDELTVVAVHVDGTRLAELFRPGQVSAGVPGPVVFRMLGDLLPALACLHGAMPGLAHGALTADHIVVTAERRLVVTDSVFGAALASMRMPAERLWSQFGLVAPDGADTPASPRGDLVQLGLLVMGLVLGRKIGPTDYPLHLPALFGQFADRVEQQRLDPSMRLVEWTRHALAADGFGSAQEALAFLGPVARVDAANTLLLSAGSDGDLPLADVSASRTPRPAVAQPADTMSAPAPPVVSRSWWKVAAVALLLIALVEAALLMRGRATPAPAAPPAAAAAQAGPAASDTAAAVAPPSDDPAARSAQAEASAPADTPAAPDTAASLPSTAPGSLAAGAVVAVSQPVGDPNTVPPNMGGLRIIAPITVQVVEGQRVLGSSAGGPILASPGQHTFDLFNNALGYRTTQSVRLPAGRIVPLRLEPPSGSLEVTSTPPASVWLDGKPVGTTPISGLPVLLGEHEVRLQHPQLGERRQRVVVQAGTPARVNVTFEP